MPPVLLGIPWPALRGPLRNHVWKKRRPQPYWGGENSGNALEASNALNCGVWAIPAVLSKGIPGNALRAFPEEIPEFFRNFFRKVPAVLGASHQKVHPNFAKILGREALLGIPFLASKHFLCFFVWERSWGNLPFESKLLPAVLLFLRIYFPQITVTVTVLKFGWISITVTVLASAFTPSFPLIPSYCLESRLN